MSCSLAPLFPSNNQAAPCFSDSWLHGYEIYSPKKEQRNPSQSKNKLLIVPLQLAIMWLDSAMLESKHGSVDG